MKNFLPGFQGVIIGRVMIRGLDGKRLILIEKTGQPDSFGLVVSGGIQPASPFRDKKADLARHPVIYAGIRSPRKNCTVLL